MSACQGVCNAAALTASAEASTAAPIASAPPVSLGLRVYESVRRAADELFEQGRGQDARELMQQCGAEMEAQAKVLEYQDRLHMLLRKFEYAQLGQRAEYERLMHLYSGQGGAHPREALLTRMVRVAATEGEYQIDCPEESGNGIGDAAIIIAAASASTAASTAPVTTDAATDAPEAARQQPASNDEPSCALCLCSLDASVPDGERSVVAVSGCGSVAHEFHRECIGRWAALKASEGVIPFCPVCKNPFTSVEAPSTGESIELVTPDRVRDLQSPQAHSEAEQSRALARFVAEQDELEHARCEATSGSVVNGETIQRDSGRDDRDARAAARAAHRSAHASCPPAAVDTNGASATASHSTIRINSRGQLLDVLLGEKAIRCSVCGKDGPDPCHKHGAAASASDQNDQAASPPTPSDTSDNEELFPLARASTDDAVFRRNLELMYESESESGVPAANSAAAPVTSPRAALGATTASEEKDGDEMNEDGDEGESNALGGGLGGGGDDGANTNPTASCRDETDGPSLTLPIEANSEGQHDAPADSAATTRGEGIVSEDEAGPTTTTSDDQAASAHASRPPAATNSASEAPLQNGDQMQANLCDPLQYTLPNPKGKAQPGRMAGVVAYRHAGGKQDVNIDPSKRADRMKPLLGCVIHHASGKIMDNTACKRFNFLHVLAQRYCTEHPFRFHPSDVTCFSTKTGVHWFLTLKGQDALKAVVTEVCIHTQIVGCLLCKSPEGSVVC